MSLDVVWFLKRVPESASSNIIMGCAAVQLGIDHRQTNRKEYAAVLIRLRQQQPPPSTYMARNPCKHKNTHECPNVDTRNATCMQSSL